MQQNIFSNIVQCMSKRFSCLSVTDLVCYFLHYFCPHPNCFVFLLSSSSFACSSSASRPQSSPSSSSSSPSPHSSRHSFFIKPRNMRETETCQVWVRLDAPLFSFFCKQSQSTASGMGRDGWIDGWGRMWRWGFFWKREQFCRERGTFVWAEGWRIRRALMDGALLLILCILISLLDPPPNWIHSSFCLQHEYCCLKIQLKHHNRE